MTFPRANSCAWSLLRYNSLWHQTILSTSSFSNPCLCPLIFNSNLCNHKLLMLLACLPLLHFITPVNCSEWILQLQFDCSVSPGSFSHAKLSGGDEGLEFGVHSGCEIWQLVIWFFQIQTYNPGKMMQAFEANEPQVFSIKFAETSDMEKIFYLTMSNNRLNRQPWHRNFIWVPFTFWNH